MGDHRAEAARRERGAVGDELVVEAAERRLDEQPAAALRALGDEFELGVGEAARVARVELAAGRTRTPMPCSRRAALSAVDAGGDRARLEPQ